jgi:hypothetical protein
MESVNLLVEKAAGSVSSPFRDFAAGGGERRVRRISMPAAGEPRSERAGNRHLSDCAPQVARRAAATNVPMAHDDGGGRRFRRPSLATGESPRLDANLRKTGCCAAPMRSPRSFSMRSGQGEARGRGSSARAAAMLSCGGSISCRSRAGEAAPRPWAFGRGTPDKRRRRPVDRPPHK